ncbi:hypothetical protein MPSEU_000537900 [Mayamaea pseudoterrestris]|nr:hypothetical protein MPSEU_000537900 [Mayamaea pseudoterrestris]
MVNVTKENFIEQSNDLIHHLQTAAFVAIDEEMTGIQVPNGSRRGPPRKDLPPKITYPDLKRAPERYSIIQLGVSLFHSNIVASPVKAEAPSDDEEEEGQMEDDVAAAVAAAAKTLPSANQAIDATEPTWTVRSYNFYMFPSSSARWDDASASREVVLNPSSVAFLNEHNMSFDLWTKQGVNYVTGDRAEQIIADYAIKHQEEQQQQQTKRSSQSVEQTLRRTVELTRTDDVRFFATTMATLREWLDNGGMFNQSTTTLLLPSCNAFLRRALYENIEREYPDLILENGGGGHIRVLRLSELEKAERKVKLQREAWSKMILNVGMWRVFEALSRACRGAPLSMQSPLFAPSFDTVDFDAVEPAWQGRRVPLVVHNGFMDILFLMTHFASPTLPDSLTVCKEMITSYFPVVYDTKVISTEHTAVWTNEQTNLSNLYNGVVRENPSVLKSIITREDSQQEHEAAYDAFMTGSIYIGLCKHIVRERSEGAMNSNPILGDMMHLQGDSEYPLALACDQREYFGRNKIFQMSMFTLDLQNSLADALKRGMISSAAYHVSGIDPSVATRDIVRCCSDLSDASGRKVEFNIVWVDDTTFIVAAVVRRDASSNGSTGNDAAALLQDHGNIIKQALQTRFSKQEKVVSLDEHFHALETANDEQLGWIGWTIDKVSSMLGFPAKRKADDVDVAARVAY